MSFEFEAASAGCADGGVLKAFDASDVLLASVTGLGVLTITSSTADIAYITAADDDAVGSTPFLRQFTFDDGTVSVPEPSTLGLPGAGLLGLFMRRKRVA